MTCTWGPSAIQRFASNVFGRTLATIPRGLKKCVLLPPLSLSTITNEIQIFCQEAVVWKRLTHPNILPLLGVTITPFQLVSNWMSGGDLPDYLKKNSDADRLKLVGAPPVVSIPCSLQAQLSDVVEGLYHLHSCNVIHGDLKGVCNCSISRFITVLTPIQPNVLVDHSGNALIADFGLATVTQNLDSIQSATHQAGHTPRWAAPEVLKEGTLSKEADIFSFAMVMIEVRYRLSTTCIALANCCFVSIQVFTGAIPFSDQPSAMAMLNMMQGRRPSQPTHPTFTAELWMLMERCWNQSPQLRPEVSEVLNALRGV